jgi:hypothetical protein
MAERVADIAAGSVTFVDSLRVQKFYDFMLETKNEV